MLTYVIYSAACYYHRS